MRHSRPIVQYAFETHDDEVADAARVDAGLDAANVASAPLDDVRPITCIARAATGEIHGVAAQIGGFPEDIVKYLMVRTHARDRS